MELQAMPRAKAPSKRDLLKHHLADALGVDVADILTRGEVVSQLGVELRYTNEKSLSNASKAALDGDAPYPPCFYKAPLGKAGWALYSRRDLRLWLDDKGARTAMENLGARGRPYDWPTVPIVKPEAGDTVEFLNRITNVDDFEEEAELDDYMGAILGRNPHRPSTPEEMLPKPEKVNRAVDWRTRRRGV
jgi:hypothetical protein